MGAGAGAYEGIVLGDERVGERPARLPVAGNGPLPVRFCATAIALRPATVSVAAGNPLMRPGVKEEEVKKNCEEQ
jgi:hypothetical protein